MELTIPSLAKESVNPLLSLIEEELPKKETKPLELVEGQEEFSAELVQDIITFCEAFFHFEGKFPNNTAIRERFSLSKKEFLIYLAEVQEPLENRLGQTIKDESLPVKSRGPLVKLDPLFALAVSELVNTADKRSTAAKLKAINLTTRQWQGYLSVPENVEYFRKRLEKAFKGTEDVAKIALAKNVESGDLQSIKYFHEFAGLYKTGNETSLNLAFLLGRVMEILARFVSPEILSQIADEVDSVLEIKEIEQSA